MVSLWVVLPVVFTVLWNALDASPTLFLYDKVASFTGGWQLSALKGKTIWLTGASSGIGASMVCELMEAGAGHLVLSSRSRDKLEKVAEKCKEKIQATTQVSIVPYDASDEAMTDPVVDSALASTGGKIDVMILNAGVYQSKPALKTDKEERNWITRVNYQAPVDLTEALIKKGGWKKRGHGHIVVVASLMAHGPHGLSSTYAASKAALRSYFFSLSSEESSWLRVDVACPGFTDTGLWDNGPTKPSKGAAMTPGRVAQLVLTGVAGPYLLFYETWISKFSGLLWIWLAHYTPGFFHFFIHVLAYVRVPMWEHEKIDVLDTMILLYNLPFIMFGKYP